MNTLGKDKKELYLLYNSLAVLVKAVEGERTTVDLRNEASIYGVVEQADGYMNIIMKDCVFTDPRGDSFKYEIFFVHARNIRYVHIPTHGTSIRIIPSIKEQLQRLRHGPVKPELPKNTFRLRRAEAKQAEDMAAVQKILNVKKEEPRCSKSDT